MNTQDKQRIDYVDLLKGFAMVMVIAIHCDLYVPDCISKQLLLFRMPLYFFLAGMFVTGRRSVSTFILHKFNRILIPAFFYSLLATLTFTLICTPEDLYNALHPLNHTLLPGPVYFIYNGLIKVGGYTWFLRCIFFTTIFLHIIIRATADRSPWLKGIIILVCGIIGMIGVDYAEFMRYNFNYIPLLGSLFRFMYYIMIPMALAMLPIAYVGYLAATHGLHHWQPTKRQAAVILPMTAALSTLTYFSPGIQLSEYIWHPQAYILCLIIIAFFVTLAKLIQYIPVINYIGTYSLIAMLFT